MTHTATVADTDLPPLPDAQYLGGDEAFGDAIYGYTGEQMLNFVIADRKARAAGAPAETAKAEAARQAYVDLTNNAVATDTGGRNYIATRPIMEAFDAYFDAPQIDATTAPDDALYFNAQRLRNVAHLVGLQSAIPEDDASLDGARGAVLGQIAAKLRAPATAPDVAKDATRLDWLDGPDILSLHQYVPSLGEPFIEIELDRAGVPTVRGSTVREAIDAAMGALPPTGSERA